MEDKPAKKPRTDADTTSVFSSLSEFSQGSEVNLLRYKNLVQKFSETYGHAPKFIARAPGRVNLIGEHIDYCGYGVLPMALEQDIAMAVSTNGTPTLTLANVDAKYETKQITIRTYEIEGHSWYNYFLCGFKGVVEEFKISPSCGMEIMVDGSIPPSAGLSSSSALVCCASLVTVYANNITLPSKSNLADLCAYSERFIGTQGGGMDQAISFLAEPGKALKIDFNPLSCVEVNLPEGHSFVIANSQVSANKAAFSGFNERVVECRLAAKLIAKIKGKDWNPVCKLLEVQKMLNCELQDMPTIVQDCLHKHPYTNKELCELFGIAEGQLVQSALAEMSPQAKEAAGKLPEFKLYQRASHVFEEAYRVVQFKEATNSGNVSSAIATELGELMSNSHKSCSDFYQCSCPQLDDLVSICMSSGALGSRLTGAGWGGCTVSIVPEEVLGNFMKKVVECFYKKPQDLASSSLFATKPGPGAALVVL